MSIVDTAMQIAMSAHGGIKNKHDGELYILHVHRVAQLAPGFARVFNADNEAVTATAWLHDVIEDTDWFITDLERELFDLRNGGDGSTAMAIIDAVKLLTKTGEPLVDYYAAIRYNQVARSVKMADLIDNFRRNHKVECEETRLRMARKYSLGFDMLM